MPETTSLTVARLLALVTWIRRQPHSSTTLGELSEHFSRPIGRIEHDLEQLTYFRDSLPGEAFELEWERPGPTCRGAARRNTPVVLRYSPQALIPTVFSPELALRALVGLKTITSLLDPITRAEIPQTMLQLERMIPSVHEASDILTQTTSTGDDHLLPTLYRAIEDRESIEFEYRSGQGTRSTRHVHPTRLAFTRNQWILEAFDWDRRAPRHFSVRQIDAIQPAPRPAVDIGHTDDTNRHDDELCIRVLLQPRAQWILGDFATQDDPHCTTWPRWASIRVWNEEWVRNLLIIASPGIEKIEPLAMSESVRERASAALDVWAEVLTSPSS